MFDFSLFSFLIVLVFLIFATYFDIKKRIIPNYLVFILFGIGIISQIIKSIVFYDLSIFLNTLLSIGVTAVVCYILWEIGVFAGGDLKLFVAISAINPFNINFFGSALGFQTITKPFFSLTLLIASIISIAPVLLILAFYQLIFQRSYLLIIDVFKSKKTLLSIFNSIIILFFIISFTNIFSLNTPYVLIFIISILLLILFNKIYAYNIKSFYLFMGIIYILLFIFAVYYNILNIFSLGALLNIIFVILIIFAFITFYRVVKQKVLCTTKTLNDLKEGDLLVNNYYKKGKKVIIKSTSMLKSIKLMLIGSYSKDLVIDSKKTGGLSKSDISFLNDCYKNNLIQDTFEVKKTIPFVPSVLIAYILLNIFGDIIWFIL